MQQEIKVKAFVNTYKVDGDKKPDFQNKDKKQNLQVAVWRNEDGSLNITIKPLEQQ